MNFTVLNVVLIAAGGILIYSAVKDIDPRDVVAMGLGQQPKHSRPLGNQVGSTIKNPKGVGDKNTRSTNYGVKPYPILGGKTTTGNPPASIRSPYVPTV